MYGCVTAIPDPGPDPVSINDCFEKVFKSEVENTTSIYNVVEHYEHGRKRLGNLEFYAVVC